MSRSNNACRWIGIFILTTCEASLTRSSAMGQQISVGSQRVVSGGGFEINIAANPCNRAEAVAVWLYSQAYTTDSGMTWTPLQMPSYTVDPTISFHPFGEYAWKAGLGGMGTGIGVHRIDLHPPSVSAPEVWTGWFDRTSVAAHECNFTPGQVNIYVAHQDGGDIAFHEGVSQEDWGTTPWEHQVAVEWVSGPFPEIPELAVGPDGTVYLVYVEPEGVLGPIRFLSSTRSEQGRTWPLQSDAELIGEVGTRERYDSHVPGSFRVFQMPCVEVDPRNGTVYASYAALSGDPGSTDVDIYLAKREPDGQGGHTWTRQLVSDDTLALAWCGSTVEVDQFFSWMAIDDRGWIHMIWHQVCDTASVEVSTIYAYSMDGGASFTQVLLNDMWTLLPQSGDLIGDYLGIACVGNSVYLLYPSTDPVSEERFICTNTIRVGVNDADFDGDCDVDLNDFATFAVCYTGAGVMAAPGCFMCNLDDDCDVDLGDFNTFSQLFDSSGCPGGGGAAAGGAPPPDPGALAIWTVGHVPGPARRTFAGRCQDLATRTADETQAAMLNAFAAAIAP